MKKIAMIIVTMSTIQICHAQDKKIKASPAYDNVNLERDNTHAKSDNNGNKVKTYTTVARLTTQTEYINLSQRKIVTYPNSTYIRKATLRKYVNK